MKHPLANLIAAAALLLPGCSAYHSLTNSTPSVPPFQPANVFRDAARLPKEIKRVAVLPLMASAGTDAEFGRESLWPVLLDELGKTRKFEVVAVSSEQMRRWTGRSYWSGEEKLPQDFFEKLRAMLGCDAVLFSRLTQYRANQPLAVGWRLKLLETEEPHLLWSVDEVFDAREPAVATAARFYSKTHPASGSSEGNERAILISPSRFAQYAASATLDTLPAR